MSYNKEETIIDLWQSMGFLASCHIIEETIGFFMSMRFMVLCYIIEETTWCYDSLQGSWSHLSHLRKDHWVFTTVYRVAGLIIYIIEKTIEGSWSHVFYRRRDLLAVLGGGTWSQVLYYKRDHWVSIIVRGVHGRICYTIEEIIWWLWQATRFMVSCIIS